MPRKNEEYETDSETDTDSDSDSSGNETDSSRRSDGRINRYGGDESKTIKKYNRAHGEKRLVGKSNNAKHGSSYLRLTTQRIDQEASTPESILGELTERFGPPLGWTKALYDPCPAAYNKAGKRVIPDLNGLAESTTWGPISYVNPPYGKIKEWFPKAIAEQKKGNSSVFLIPFRPFTKYFLEALKHITWIECIFKGVGFKGYAAKIPHPMCTIVFLGKGVKDVPQLHMTQTPCSKQHTYTGLTTKITGRPKAHTFVQRVPKPHAFDDATLICTRYGIPKPRIHIMINSSNMVNASYLDKEKIEKARKSWKNAYALLVPFYNYSVAFQVAQKETSILAYSSPILSNYAGEGKCRFCSVLFVFCPKDAQFKKFIKDPILHPFKMYFNYSGYLPTLEQLVEAKRIKEQKSKNLPGSHGAKFKGKGGKASKSAKKSKKKQTAKRSKRSKDKKRASKPKRTPKVAKAAPALNQDLEGAPAATAYIQTFIKRHGKLPSFNTVRATFVMKTEEAKALIESQRGSLPTTAGRKRKRTGAAAGHTAKKRKVVG